MTDVDDGLSEYERRFVEAYMGDAHGVGSQAVLIVSPDVKPASARSQAYDLLRRPHIKKALRDRTENDELVMGRLERLRALTRIARGEVTEVRHIVTKKVKGGRFEVQLIEAPPSIADRMGAIDRLSKAAGEHLPSAGGDDDVMGKLMALLSGATIPQLVAMLAAETKEEAKQ